MPVLKLAFSTSVWCGTVQDGRCGGACASSPRKKVTYMSLGRPRKPTVARGVGALAAAVAVALQPVAAAPPGELFLDEAGVVPKSSAAMAARALAAVREQTGYTVHFTLPDIPFGISPDEYALTLFEEWDAGPRDVVVVGGTKIARAGVCVGSEAAVLVTKDIAESIGNQTYALKAGEELYVGAVNDVNNRLIAVLNGERDPGAPDMTAREVVQSFKTKAETDAQRGKYIKVVGALLIIAFVAPLIQTAWYLR